MVLFRLMRMVFFLCRCCCMLIFCRLVCIVGLEFVGVSVYFCVFVFL